MAANIATINMEKILTDTNEGRRNLDRIKKQEKPIVDKVNKLILEVKSSLDKYNRDKSAGVNPAELGKQQQILAQKDIEAQQAQAAAQMQIQQIRFQVMSEFEKKVFPIIDGIAKEQKIDLIFPHPQRYLVYAADALDITNEIVKQINENVKIAPEGGPEKRPTAPTPPRSLKI
jgi:Skp family chaperone for outer membrane proteins